MLLSIIKIVTYTLEYRALRIIGHVSGLPVDPLPDHSPEQKQYVRAAFAAMWSDWQELVRAHPAAHPFPRVGHHLGRYVAIVADLPRFARRKRAGIAKDLRHLDLSGDYPEYYKTNYHYQTDGYFSEASAHRYDHQIELLFKGIGHILRKVSYALLRPHINPKSKVLEFGAGTGTSGAQFKMLFPDCELTLLDPSPSYLSYAQKTYPGCFAALRAGAVEALEDDAAYDVVFSCFTMHEIPQEHWDEVGRRLYRALRPGGHVLIIDSQQESDAENGANHFALDHFEKEFFEPYFAGYRRANTAELLVRSGFELVESRVMLSKAVLARKPA